MIYMITVTELLHGEKEGYYYIVGMYTTEARILNHFLFHHL